MKGTCKTCRFVNDFLAMVEGEETDMFECNNYRSEYYCYCMDKTDTCGKWEPVPEPKEPEELDLFGIDGKEY